MGHLTDTYNRFEVKYLMNCREASSLLDDVRSYLTPDEYSDPERGYSIYSVYWDSPDLGFFWEKVEGLKYRRKLRFRRYVGSDDIHVEIKQRTDRTLQKRRCLLPAHEVDSLFAGLAAGYGSLPTEEVDSVVAEAAVMCHRRRLAPRIGVRYQRRAFSGIYEPGLRVTFDTRVQYRRVEQGTAVEPFDVGKYVIDPRTTIMEVKYTSLAPLWLARTISRFNLQMIRMSKYCSAVDQEYYGGQVT